MIQRGILQHSRRGFLWLRSAPLVQFSQVHQFPPVRLSAAHSSIAPRCYSTATETKESVGSESPAADPSKPESKEENLVQKELETGKKEIIELKDKYLRSVADFRNLQDRTQRSISDARSFAISRFASDLVESVDNLDRALETVSPEKISGPDANKELVNLYEGLKMTDTILMQTLKKHGLERFDPSVDGEKFDPNLHEATFQTKVEGKEDGTVFMTQQKGFLLNGRVVRAAKVGVVKNN
ncbi:Mitochondrial matrix cochaperone [Puttea exsequens]|nr:Mitochondrial matrix cochaperone [Puttea exsequens]